VWLIKCLKAFNGVIVIVLLLLFMF